VGDGDHADLAVHRWRTARFGPQPLTDPKRYTGRFSVRWPTVQTTD
jgi:hypothetical protein